MTEQNRVVVVNSLDDIRIEHRPAPQPGPGEVLVRSKAVGICGSDMHAAHGRHPFVSLPLEPGHEIVGRVEGVGAGVSIELVGARVVVEPNLACGGCLPCQEGRYNICETLAVFGCQTSGGMTDLFTIAADRVVPIPDDLDWRWSALIEPAATPVHAVRRAGDLTGRRVVVFGAGPIGLFVLLAARRAGATVVTGDILESKRALAGKLGAAGAFDPRAENAADVAVEALGGKADVVFDCVSRESTLHLGIALLRKGGTLMVVGVPAGPTRIDLDLVQDREIAVFGNLMYVRDDYDEAIALLQEKSFDLADLVTAEFELDQAAEAFAASDDPEQVKVLVLIGEQD